MLTKLIDIIDKFLNNITMYRLVLYYLIILLGLGIIFSFAGILPYNGFDLLFFSGFLLAVGLITNIIFAKVYKVPANVESVYISALILALIITPTVSLSSIPFLFWAAVWTMASKFIFAINKKHLFNPVAISVFLLSVTIGQSASWWVGNLPLLPLVLVGGLLVVRKIKRVDMMVSFMAVSLVTILGATFLRGFDVLNTLQKIVFHSPWLFFVFVMLTEPLTTPPTKKLQIIYAAIVGFLFAPQLHLGSLYTTPESALLIGNVFSYLVSSRDLLVLKLKEKIQIAPDIYDFVFTPSSKPNFKAGQYLEWTIDCDHNDERGNRRYFTLSSSPTEDDLRIGVKFYPQSSSFKKEMLAMDIQKEIIAGQLAGDFVLSEDPNQKYVFVAGGIGITPFRSMLKYLLDTGQKRTITLFYANKTAEEIVYKDVFDRAGQELGLKTVYSLSDKEHIPSDWQGRVSYIDEQMIKDEVPDFLERKFYLSGPHSLVTSFEQTLKNMGVKKEQIKTDFFPGFV